MEIVIDDQGYESVLINNAVVSKLSEYLNRKVAHVWILGHMPNTIVEWWRTSVPLNLKENITGRVRSVAYDLQMTTSEFLDRVSAFDEYGITLIQSAKQMPDTLDISHIPDEMGDKILVENGAFLRIWLPHAMETACLKCYEQGYLRRMKG